METYSPFILFLTKSMNDYIPKACKIIEYFILDDAIKKICKNGKNGKNAY